MIPLTVDQMLQKARAALIEGYLGFASAASLAITARAPQRADGWVTLGQVLVAQGRFDEADAALDRAESLEPANLELRIARARLRAREGRDVEVIEICTRIHDQWPNHVESTMLMGEAFRRQGRLDESLSLLRSVPIQPAIACSIASTLLSLGQPTAVIETLTPYLDHTNLPPKTKYGVHHLLGEAQEKLGHYESALQSYTRAKRSIKVNFSETGFRSRLALIREVFSAEAIQRAPKPSVRTQCPVFIASMPRSGTTLLDRIIGSHPLASGAGETRALRGQITEWTSSDPGLAWPRNVLGFSSSDLDRIAQRYIDQTTPYGPNAQRIADKNLHNWMMVGLIAMALPEARIIHLQRDPMDIGISCFERIEPGTVSWSVELEHIALAIKGTESLMAHWKEVSGMPILVVRYEDLVRDQETQVRRILDFIGLPWDAACLQHHVPKDNHLTAGAKTAPPTLGSEQAARAINDRSIGRASRFGSLLDPLREALAKPL